MPPQFAATVLCNSYTATAKEKALCSRAVRVMVVCQQQGYASFSHDGIVHLICADIAHLSHDGNASCSHDLLLLHPAA